MRAALVAGCAAALLMVGFGAGHAPAGDGLEVLRSAFVRPDAVPFPADVPWSAAKETLGRTLFFDPALSKNGKVSCASCHDPALGFTDGVRFGRGVAGTPLARHTPALWNLAWEERFFWDGRAASLEEQAVGPMQHPSEMGADLDEVVARLARVPAYRRLFKAARPSDPEPSRRALVEALATYERMLVSPRTRFDRWVAGDDGALNAREIAGLKLFSGPAGCMNCHSGWAFTDRAFHDIGLPGSNDRGRGGVIGLAAADYAFKTPGLRELAWTAPYMHDGSKPTLEAAVRHYAGPRADRPSVSPDLPRIALDDEAVDALVAFLLTLSSDSPPVPERLGVALLAADAPPPVGTRTISQKDKAFTPSHVSLKAGETLTIVNDDVRIHNVRSDGDAPVDTGAQDPGASITLAFPRKGRQSFHCGIHPGMKLDVLVR